MTLYVFTVFKSNTRLKILDLECKINKKLTIKKYVYIKYTLNAWYNIEIEYNFKIMESLSNFS